MPWMPMTFVQELCVDTVIKFGMLLSVCQLELGIEGIYGWGCHMLKSSLV